MIYFSSSQVSDLHRHFGATFGVLFREMKPLYTSFDQVMSLDLWSTHRLAPRSDVQLSSSSSTRILRKIHHVFRCGGISSKSRSASTQWHLWCSSLHGDWAHNTSLYQVMSLHTRHSITPPLVYTCLHFYRAEGSIQHSRCSSLMGFRELRTEGLSIQYTLRTMC